MIKSPTDFDYSTLPTLQMGTVTVPMPVLERETPFPATRAVILPPSSYHIVADDMETETEDYFECLRAIGDAFLRGVEHLRVEYSGVVLQERWLKSEESEAQG